MGNAPQTFEVFRKSEVTYPLTTRLLFFYRLAS
jgi:hypothetical protein